VLLWRISRHRNLDGVGGFLVDGRWHSRGHPIVYSSPEPSTALIEWIVHLELNVDEIPPTIPFIVVDAPENTSEDRLDSGALPADWRTNHFITREIGDVWIASRRSALLYVPSAIVPETQNVLINPAHADSARLTISRTIDAHFDPRLLAGRTGCEETAFHARRLGVGTSLLLNPLRCSVDVSASAADETGERDVELACEIDGEAAGRRHGADDRDARNRTLLQDLVSGAAADDEYAA
jgi:RES domain-containing protein